MGDRDSRFVRDLTDQPVQGADALAALRRFASELGWRPSDQLDRYPGTERFCNGHLVVEHGFDRTAVISFLHADTPYPDLATSERRSLLELSYNNMVDWHLLPERAGMRVVFNRTDPPQDQFFPATLADDVWRADAFERLTGKRPSPNVRALDDALIGTVSFWKRAIRTDMGEQVGLPQVSAMINSVIMVRALEDYRNRIQPARDQLLPTILAGLQNRERNAAALIRQAFVQLEQPDLPEWLNQILAGLDALNAWDPASLRELVGDFYRGRYSPYKYNFHLISKHALSRIYEHYVSELRDDSAPDMLLFRGALPEEIRNKDLGSIYTPQYVARFFGRYLREHRTPRAFRCMRTLDHACGSAMFLRTLLELQCDPADDGFSNESVRQSFANTYGVDVDANACQAARLSLALLHLVLTGDFPATLNIETAEAIELLQQRPNDLFDVVVANPPFVKWDGLPQVIRERLSSYMLDEGLGKQDLYLAFLKAAMEHTAPGGAICFVLPHSFLLSKGASKVRQQLCEQFAIRVLADLSEVAVFESTGIYVVLLVAERTSERNSPAIAVKCREFVGAALQDALAGRLRTTDGYQVFQVDQKVFKRNRWQILPAEEASLQDAIEAHRPLSDFFEVRQGLVTGADDVFIRPWRDCPKSDRHVWHPLLLDREMRRFSVPARPTMAVFMPFDAEGGRLTDASLRKDYPETWQELSRSKARLSERSSVRAGTVKWWEPERPRSPEKMFVPKIVTPHLVLLPRFGIDVNGKYAVSHSPYLVPKSESGGRSLLQIVCAVMNSAIGHWQLASSSHRYSRGYLMLEVKTLREFRMPDPALLPTPLMRKIVRLVDSLADATDDAEAIAALDESVGEAYGLSEAQMALTGVGG